MQKLATLLPEVKNIAEAAGQAILTVYRTDFDVDRKDDDSPLTQADLSANRVIMAGLKKLTPELPRLSEEGADIAFATRRTWSRYWLIDPLDGTREFVKKNGEFTVNIALIDNGVPVLGVVYAPDMDKFWFAAQGVGAFKQENGKQEAISTRPAQTARPRVLVSKSHRGELVDAVLARLPDYDAVSVGSSLKFCVIAEGEADFYPRLGPTSEWDTGAAHAVLACAGGRVTTTDGEDLGYNQKESILNPHFLAFGDPDTDWTQYLAE